MSCEKLGFSPFGAHWDSVHSSPLGLNVEFMSTPVFNGFEVFASWLVGPKRLGTQLLPAHISPFLKARTDFDLCGS